MTARQRVGLGSVGGPAASGRQHPATSTGPPLGQLADLLRQLLRQRNAFRGPNFDSAWLLPGQRPGQPLIARYLGDKLRQHGIPVQAGRSATLQQLVLQAPAPVIATMLGFHHTHTAASSANTAAPGTATPPATTPSSRRSNRAGNIDQLITRVHQSQTPELRAVTVCDLNSRHPGGCSRIEVFGEEWRRLDSPWPPSAGQCSPGQTRQQ